MNNDLTKNAENELDDLQSSNKSSFLDKFLKGGFYELLITLFHKESRSGNFTKWHMFTFALVNLIQSLHMIGLLVDRKDIDNWDSYSLAWSVILYLRIDHAITQLNVHLAMSVGLEVLLLCMFSLCCILAVSLYNLKNPPKWCFQMLRVAIVLLVSVFPIPSQLMIHSLIFSHFGDGSGPVWNIPFAVRALLSLVGMYICYTVGSGEIRHSQKEKRVDSKSCSDLNIYTFKIRFEIIIVFYLKGNSQVNYLC